MVDQLDEDRTFISVMSIVEIQRVVVLMDEGRRHDALAEWLERALLQRFEHRVLTASEAVALAWGSLRVLPSVAVVACHSWMMD